MRIIILIPFSLFFSCVISKKNNCTENKKFEIEYFKKINYVETHMFSHQDSTFRNSLIFISNYAPVSFYETMNYARIYPPQALEKDKREWLKWYEENKCTNIQLKDKYLIPERYKEFFEY